MPSLRLPLALAAWGSPEFKQVLKQELEQPGPAALPLQQGLSQGSHTLEAPITVMVIGASEAAGSIHARVGVFFSSIIAGCNCADDPTPVSPQNEYCEIRLVIDRATAKTIATLAED
ncbi:MAG: hypothetical protein AB1513_06360 [Pseudomonadota bacterium]